MATKKSNLHTKTVSPNIIFMIYTRLGDNTMNNIHEKDWAEEGYEWNCHSGMRSNPYDDDAPPANSQEHISTYTDNDTPNGGN
jgi:lipopolysaccharide biosynthesis glycosyltransferase